MGFMASDDEKDPPVPAHLAGAAKRVHRDNTAAEQDPDDHKAPVDKPNN
jgi:hypothetical protein